MIKPRIYLSGRLTATWQDDVTSALSDAIFIDPRTSGLDDPRQYTSWNLVSIDMADMVFAYMERGNPSGYGIALEVGYANARGKHVILVDERSPQDSQFAKYFVAVRAAANVCFDSLDSSLVFMRSLLSGKTR